MPAALTPGSPAPDFHLPRDGGGEVSLADFRGRKLVLFFFPKASTSGCTRESQAFSALKDKFAAADTDLVGVSADPVKKQNAFKSKYDLTVILASDETHEMLEAYGVWAQKSMYGRTYMGIVRTTVLISPEGQVARVWPKVKIEGHAEEVLAAAQAL